MNFINSLENTLSNRTQRTENGAIGYATTGKELLDLNFKVSSLRRASEREIEDLFANAFYADKIHAMKWLFFARDVRGGMGERRLFRICMDWLAIEQTDIAKAVLNLIAEYGRYDDLIELVNSPLEKDVMAIITAQLISDMNGIANEKSISLLAKWMPSINTSSDATKKLARKIIRNLKTTEREYRKALSAMREYINVVERKMTSGEWSEIDYEAVPSRANLKYNSAFLRNDEDRRRAYLGALSKGEAKINGATNFPHDIVASYRGKAGKDIALEALWEALPNYVKGDESTLCVADGSGSMSISVDGHSSVRAIDVANALAIYFAERCKGQFKDKYITFSMRPQLVALRGSLRDKLYEAYRHNECANTNVEAVFDLILTTAIQNHMTQDEMPKNILILSDMEFDSCVSANTDSHSYSWVRNPLSKTLFDTIAQKYAKYGYKLPRLVFWNICSRTGTIPVKKNDLGVALISGFSPAVVKMVLSNKTDPYECLLEQLDTERYQAIEDAIKSLV